MKLCYLYIANTNTQQSGVDLKVKSKFSALQQMFPSSLFVQFDGNTTIKIENTDYYIIPVNQEQRNYFSQYYYNQQLYKTIATFIQNSINDFDYYIMRYPMANLGLLNLVKRHKGKLIFEHNTNELAELKISINKIKVAIPFSLGPSVLSCYINDVFFGLPFENYFGKKIIQHAAGGICVTPEIERIEKEKYFKYKTVVITNGLNQTTKNHINNNQLGETLKGVFIAGTNAIWNGLERILESLQKTNKDKKIELYFIGRVDSKIIEPYKELVNKSIFIKEYMKSDDLKSFLNQMHFAIGTSAIHKKKMKEGAVLKVRECLSNGLPIVLGHHDPYIHSISELKKYCLEFPSDDSIIDFNQVNLFIRKLYHENQSLNTDIQSSAYKYLTWETVLKPLPTFLNTLNA